MKNDIEQTPYGFLEGCRIPNLEERDTVTENTAYGFLSGCRIPNLVEREG